MSLDICIRHSTNQDLQDMVILIDQLGYPTTYAEMQERYKHIKADANYTTLVAEIRGRVVGLIGMQTSYLYEKNDRHCRIMVLVIHEHYRGRSIGRQLLQAAEQWAATNQVYSISLNSSNSTEREAAHAFYKEMGYTVGSTGFNKRLLQLQHV